MAAIGSSAPPRIHVRFEPCDAASDALSVQ
jgi:hypothetical protein